VLAYGFKMQGKGLWGTIIAFGTVTRNLNRMVGLDFMQQVETPGLGARITEHEFKHYFCNLNLEGFDQNIPETPQIVMVRKKERTNREESTNELQAITGATQTCNGVLQMVNRDLKFYLNLISKNRDFIDGQLQRNDG